MGTYSIILACQGMIKMNETTQYSFTITAIDNNGWIILQFAIITTMSFLSQSTCKVELKQLNTFNCNDFVA